MTIQKFPLGQLVATRGVMDAFPNFSDQTALLSSPVSPLARHARGDWGDLSANDRTLNDEAIANGDRILSAYNVGSIRIWIITEGDRSATTILLPEEY